MFSRVWARHKLQVTHNAQRLKQLFPKWLGGSALMPLRLRIQKLHDIAERQLVNVDDFLLNLRQIDGDGMPTGAAAAFTPCVTDAEHTVLFLPTLRARQIRPHYEVAWINPNCACASHNGSVHFSTKRKLNEEQGAEIGG